MKIQRREFMHLIGAQGLVLPWIPGCGDEPSPMGSGSSGSTGGTSGSTTTTTGTTSGLDSTGVGSSSGSLDEDSGSTSTGEVGECMDPWWLCGNFAPVDEVEAFDLPVEGALPASLEGLYLRNGANPSEGTSGHWFVGDGMVHGVVLGSKGTATYRARYVQTDLITGKDPGIPTDTAHPANTSVVWHGDRLMAIAEVGFPYELSPEDLSTVGVHDFGGSLVGPMTAHPKIDPMTGEMVFFGYDLFMPVIRAHFVDPDGTLSRTEVIDVPEVAMMHDFQVTPNHVVFWDLPVVFDLDLVIADESMPFSWQPDYGARLGIMPRAGTGADVVWIDIELCYIFHSFNAYEDGDGNIIVDVVWYPEMWVRNPSDFMSQGSIVRFTVDPVRGTASRQVISEVHAEFPRIDPRLAMQAHRYGYGVSSGVADGSQPRHTIVKYDLGRGTAQSHALEDRYIDELLFVPDSPGAGEDEGWLMGYAYDPRGDSGELLVFDATDIPAGPVARVGLPQRVPYGFHGAWLPSA